MHARKVGNEKPQSLIRSNKRKKAYSKIKQIEFCFGMGSGRKRVHWACLVVVVDEQPMGWSAALKRCPS